MEFEAKLILWFFLSAMELLITRIFIVFIMFIIRSYVIKLAFLNLIIFTLMYHIVIFKPGVYIGHWTLNTNLDVT